MTDKTQIIKGPIAPSWGMSVIYSVTLENGYIVSSPAGFGEFSTSGQVQHIPVGDGTEGPNYLTSREYFGALRDRVSARHAMDEFEPMRRAIAVLPGYTKRRNGVFEIDTGDLESACRAYASALPLSPEVVERVVKETYRQVFRGNVLPGDLGKSVFAALTEKGEAGT